MKEIAGENMETGLEIAVIGMSARFPGAKNTHQFWNNLKNGIEAIFFSTNDELKEKGVEPRLLKEANFVNSNGGVLKDKEYFDACFFDYTPREAELMNPQMRILHECAWEALEDASYDIESYKGLIGLYVGASPDFHWEAGSILSGKSKDLGMTAAGHLTNKDFMATRVSYNLDLKGPSVILHSTCSTSLLAIHMACQELLSGQCDMALAGGVTLTSYKNKGYLYQEGTINSPDGHCRAFDLRAKGTVGSDGVGIVVLKSLDDAIVDKDYIYALVKGSAVNNDGKNKVGYTAPSINGQAGVIKSSHRAAGVTPGSISYIETHGTATTMGDPIEFEALVRAFNTDKKGYCGIGSVKTNIGHTDSAAGVAGFIKTVLALKHKQLPPSLHFETPNPKIDLENSPFYVVTTLTEWKSGHYPLRAGVSSFGIGGTNVHVVLEEWRPAQSAKREAREYQLILLSAKTPSALDEMTVNLAGYLKENPGINLADAAYTSQVGRRAFKHRRMSVCSQVDEAAAALHAEDSRKLLTSSVVPGNRPVVFMFSGLGSQYVNMGLGIYQTEPVFRQEMDRCFEILKPLLGYDIKEILYPGRGEVSSPAAEVPATCHLHLSPDINQTEIAQPVIFAIEYSLAKLLVKWGVKPGAMIGYSFGEYAAACLSGVFSLEDALRLIVSRGKLIKRVAAGSMLSVPLAVQELKPLLNGGLSIAIDNGQSCIAAGSTEAIAALEKKLREKKYLCIRLQSSRAIHSKMMESILKDFKSIAAEITLNEPQIPYISNVTGDWLTPQEALDPGYWPRHLRETVRFADGIKHLIKKENAIFIELGPGRDLGALLKRYLDKDSNQKIINPVRPLEKKTPDDRYLLSKIGQLWLYGVNIDWSEFYREEKRSRIPLPTYPFQGQRYWIDNDFSHISLEKLSQKSLAGEKPDIADWFYIPSWERSPLLPGNNENRELSRFHWLVFLDECGIGSLLVKQLKQEGHEVITVGMGAEFEELGENHYRIRPRECHDYEALFDILSLRDRIPNRIVHLWGVGKNEEIEILELQDLGFYSLLYLAKAMGRKDSDGVVEISVVTNNLQEVTGEENLCPGKATVISPVLVIPQEHPRLFCRSLDIILPKSGSSREKRVLHQLQAELLSKSLDRIIAFRGNHRLVRVFKPIHLGEIQEDTLPLKEEGVYLITGGLGKIGLIIAEYLSKGFRAKLILTGRSAFPVRDEWEHWLTTHDQADSVSCKIRKLKEMESLGAKLMIFSADAAEQEEMQMVIHEAEEQFGSINGVIHSAGLAEGDTFQVMEKPGKSQCEQHFQAKVYGVIVLENLLRDKELDFCWLMSSVSTVLGGLQFAAYAAANAFMDAFVNKHNQLNQRHWISVDWDGMGPGETVTGFQRILSLRGLNQVVVSNGGNLQDRIDKWVKLETFRNGDNFQHEDAAAAYPRPDLSNPYIAPRNQAEGEIVGILQDLFGFEEIGIEDDFFELGGDSLKAITVISRVHKVLKVEIPLTEFFKRPTVRQLAQYVDKAEKSTYSSVDPVEKKEYYALSSIQVRLYILQLMEKESVSYNEPEIKILEGNLNRDRFEEAFKRLIRRHECLRTSIEVINDEPFQKIYQPREVEFAVEFYEAGEDEAKELQINFVKPFDLSQPPFLRAGLIKVGEAKHILMLDMHHLVTDGVSYEIFINDYIALYNGEELPLLRLRYKDYAEWRKRDRVQRTVKIQGKFWLKEFAGEIPVLNLPTDHERPAIQSFDGNSIDTGIGKEETRALKTLSLKENVTLYMILLSAFNIVLSKLSNQEDIIIGTPVAGRRHTDLQNIMGVFVNTLALRNYPAGDKTFKEFLSEIKINTLKAFENQDYPFEDLIEQVSLERDMSRNPLFDVMFVLQNVKTAAAGKSNVEAAEVRVLPYNYENKTSKFDLTLKGEEKEENLLFLLEYCSGLFEKETVERLIRYFKKVVSVILENTGIRLVDIEIMSKEEKEHILFDFNDTASGYPEDKLVRQWFEEQARKSPGALALSYRDSKDAAETLVTYRELNREANRLARLLRVRGLKQQDIVGIMMERSVEMMAAILAVLKAGGIYVPIDPGFPGSRITYLAKDTNMTAIVSTSQYKQRISDVVPHKIFWDIDQPVIQEENPENPENSVDSQAFAYIIYTSGSTGIPKGTPVSHRNVNNYTTWFTRQFHITKEDKFCFLGSFCFDMSVTSIVVPLISGASIYIVKEKIERDPELYSRCIAENRISVIKLTPTQFKPLLPFIEIEDLGDLRYIILGGEALDGKDVRKYLQCYPRQTIVNEYGPTEATVATVFYEISADTPDHDSAGIYSEPGEMPAGNNIPIGRPIFNTRVYILDRFLQVVPIGVIGEICIGGDSVADGYLNRVELTRQCFINAPFINDGSTVIYKSGDLGRYREDGNIEYLGRRDSQVKIRGYRIEVEEIESVLLGYEGVKGGAAAVKEDTRGNKSLAAYLILHEGVTTAEIREYLGTRLPDYMIPAILVEIDELPQAASGKIDRSKLPDISALQLSDSQAYQEPTGIEEKLLVDTWIEVLGVNRVGVHDNFFQLGGDSIKTIQIASKLNKKGYKVEMRDIFRYPTISKLSPFLEKIGRIPDQSIIHGSVPLTPIQRWFFKNKFADSHHFNQAVMLYSGEGLEEKAVKAISRKLQEHHDALRMTYKEENGEIIQHNRGLEAPLSLEVYDLKNQKNAKETLERRVNRIQASIDLENGPLMKLGLFHLDDGDRLLIVIHHLVIDGVSWRILFEDIETLYQQYKNRENFQLPLKSDSFKLWSEKLSAYADSQLFLKEKTYWAKIESTAVPIIKRDFEEEENYLKDSDRLSFSLSEEETKKLLTKVNYPFGTGINDILLTALGLAIKKAYGNNQMLIALEGHGREGILKDININRTIGWFTSLFPVVLDFSFARDLSRQIKEVKECLNQVPHKGIGYGILKYLTAEDHKEEIDFTLTPRISFNYLGQIDEDLNSVSFEIAKESPGNTQNIREKNNYDLDVSGIIVNKQLVKTIVYNKKRYKSETIETLLNHYKKELSRIISYCSAREKVELTPGDLTYKELSIETVDQLNKQYQYTLEDIYTLSPMQEGMLFHALLDYSSPAYFEQLTYGFLREYDVSLVEKSLNELFKRYDILRTAFVHEYEGIHRPIQVVLKERPVDFYYEDLRRVTDKAEREAFIKEFKEKDKERLFDLSKDVLMRVSIFRTAEAEYKFIWSFHHILMDGWCTGILISDFFEIYNSYLQHRPYQLPGVKPFSTYIQWLEQQDMEASKNYWYNYLNGYDEIAGIPGIKITGPREKVYKNERVSFSFDRLKTNALVELTSRNHVTLNTIIQTVWGILLGKYNGKQDVVFGAVVSGRPPGVEDVEVMVGLFINTIPVRISFAENSTLTFKQLLQKVQEEAIISEPHHYYPLAEIQTQSTLKQNLLDHIMIYENYPIAAQIEELTGRNHPEEAGIHLKLSDIDVFEQTNYDFNIVASSGEQLTIHFDYNGNVYQRDWVLRISKHLKKLFRQIIDSDNEELEIDALTLITGEEKEQILTEFNKTAAKYPQDKSIHVLFEEQVERTPDNIAVVGQSAKRTAHVAEERHAPYARRHAITYRELNEKANRLARFLREKNVKPGTTTAIMLERSAEMIIGIFGILKAGAAYLPIEPGYPKDRIMFMLCDSNAGIVLTTGFFQEMARQGRGEHNIRHKWRGEVCFIDEELAPGSRLSRGLHEASNSERQPGHLAYVIYTSGSTGMPKGVMIEHTSVVNRLNWMQACYPIGEHDVILQKTTFVFDVSVWELFWWSFYGASLSLLGPGDERSPEAIIEAVEKHKVTTMHFVPSMLNAFLEYSRGGAVDLACLASLRQVFASGEALHVHQVETFNRLLQKTNGTRLINLYGPTEATVDVSYFNCPTAETPDMIPIGKPIANINLYIVDKNLHPQPIGVKGELCISGVGLARGYLNQPELTAQKFQIPNSKFQTNNAPFGQPMQYQSPSQYPINPIPHYPIYMTGDLVKWLPDGNIEFLGRIDNQVKIRGFRIELGEIENQLQTHDRIKEAVVIAKKDANRDNYLCAYIVPLPSYSFNSTDLREYLSAQLPDYMIPSFFMALEKIPLTPSGKVNRKNLPEPGNEKIGIKNKYIAPGNEKEKIIVDIWSEILKMDKIGITDNFFELGGHSLKAVSIISRVNKEIGGKLPISIIFDRPTVAGLMEELSIKKDRDRLKIENCPEKPYYELSHAQKRLWFFSQLEPDNPAYHIPLNVRFIGELDTYAFEKAIHLLVQHHEALRTSIRIVEPGEGGEKKEMEELPVQIIHNQVELDILWLDIANLPKEEKQQRLRQLVKQEGLKSFDLGQAPLFRTALVKLDSNEYVVIFVMHHIISDAWSIRLMIDEFAYFYNKVQGNRQEDLTPLKFHYKDFVHWQNQLISEDRIKEYRDYWHNKLSGELPVTDLLTDFPRPSAQSPYGDKVTFIIDEPLTEKLKKLSRKKACTLFMILMAAFKVLVYRYTLQEDIIIGTLTAGRSIKAWEKIVGYFVNILALRDTVNGQETFGKMLGHVRKTMLEAFDHQEYPFDQLVNELNVKRDISRTPVFDIMLVFQNQEDLQIKTPLEYLKMEIIEKEYVVNKYDMYLDITEMPRQVAVDFEFRSDLYKKETIQRMVDHYLNILDYIAHSHDELISAIDMISAAEKRKLLKDFNDTKNETPRDKCYHQLFEAQVLKTPGKIAAKHNLEVITYQELNERANQIARYLIGNGIKPGTFAAFYMKRSIHMLAAIIGVFKAGAAYLPIETDYPGERVRYMLEHAEVRILFADGESVSKVDASISLSPYLERVLCMDTGLVPGENIPGSAAVDTIDQLKQYPPDNSPNQSEPHHYAYMIYTSGTTGKPKGVPVHQLGMINHLYAKINDLTITENDRIAHTASPCFDISVWQFLAALPRGGTTVVFDYEVVLNPEALLTGLQQENITIFESVPSLMAVFIEMLENEKDKGLKNLRWMIATGEALKPQLVKQWFYHYPGIKLVNAYGPTEASDDITHYVISSVPDDGQLSVPIGKPVQNMRIYILDKNLSLCPVGVRGEICVAGLGVGKGYWKEPEKNRRAFVPNPYAPGTANQDYAVLYKTGDIGYFRQDGNIECLGRIDHQVKIRGFRIELEEIEAVMLKYQLLGQCAVVVKKEEGQADSLVAFLKEKEPIDLEEFKKYLLGYLPPFMIPSLFVKLEQLPLGRSGKIHRQALMEADIDVRALAGGSKKEFTAPGNQTEKQIAKIWSEVLKLGDIGIYDNFFDLGGHSLLIPRIHRKLDKKFPGKCKITDLFRYFTIYELSRHIDEIKENEEDEIIALSID